MMRKLVIFILIVLILLFASIFVVNERENVVITGPGNQQTVESTGLHFAWPIIQKVNYIYTNERSSLLSLVVESTATDDDTLQIEILIGYHVINPVVYLQGIKRLSQGGVNKELAKLLLDDISHKIQREELVKFNQQGNLLEKPVDFLALGIRVDQIALVKFRIMPSKSEVKQKAESVSFETGGLSIESAYYEAQVIKSRTALEVGTINQKMQLKGPVFYDYFSKLKMYEQKAKTKADMPPLSDIYSK